MHPPPFSLGNEGRAQKAMEAAMLAETSEVQNQCQNSMVGGRPPGTSAPGCEIRGTYKQD